jgi:hypothetical protein
MNLSVMPDLKALTDSYGRELMANGYEETIRVSYAFARLSNGVNLFP